MGFLISAEGDGDALALITRVVFNEHLPGGGTMTMTMTMVYTVILNLTLAPGPDLVVMMTLPATVRVIGQTVISHIEQAK